VIVTLKAIPVGSRSDRDGAVKLTLEIPASEATKALAVALQTQTVFDVTFKPEETA
jgi:hypothetical protein